MITTRADRRGLVVVRESPVVCRVHSTDHASVNDLIEWISLVMIIIDMIGNDPLVPQMT